MDKPAGVSSHDVVNAVRRATGERRVGHAGTLDPFATGLLVVLVGRATRLTQYVRDEPKRYVARVRFGAETDTEDLGGNVTREAPLPARAALEDAARTLVGRIAQVPPAYSAKRIDGKRAYAIARTGEAVDLPPVMIDVHELRLHEFEQGPDGVASCGMTVSCGGGTYVRSLARDLARAAGSAAHLTALRRQAAGEFELGRAVPLERVREGGVTVLPAIDALHGYPVQALAADEVAKIARGIDVEARVAGEHAALVDAGASGSGDTLVAFAARRPSERGDRWQPRVVMREPSA